MFGVRRLIFLLLTLLLTVCGQTAYGRSQSHSELMSDNSVMAMCLTDIPDDAALARERQAEKLAGTAMNIYEQIYSMQSAQDAKDLQAVDQLILHAEDRISLPPPAKFDQALKWKKLLAWAIDRFVWGGGMFALGACLAYFARRKELTRDISRLVMSLAMISFGCSYALLLPLIAAVVILGSFVYAIRSAIAYGANAVADSHGTLPAAELFAHEFAASQAAGAPSLAGKADFLRLPMRVDSGIVAGAQELHAPVESLSSR
ncbi:MAG TPA: hypothetical protein V6C81_17295 [Planktothrix sp.]|jgi:hypothetical protein